MSTVRMTRADLARQTVARFAAGEWESLTVEAVREACGASETEAIVALVVEVGAGWARDAGIVPAGDAVIDGRRFAVLRGGRRWTKVPEYMSNDQRTARFMVDEGTGEVRLARSWKAPEPTRIGGESAQFVHRILAAEAAGGTFGDEVFDG